MSDVRSECEKLQMAITQQHVIQSTSRLVLGWVFSKDGLALFNLTVHELHELYYDRPTSQRGIGQTPCSFEHIIYLVTDKSVDVVICYELVVTIM